MCPPRVCACLSAAPVCSLCVTAFPCVQYKAKGRISAEAALQHPYFKSLGERVHLLPDSKCPWSPGMVCAYGHCLSSLTQGWGERGGCKSKKQLGWDESIECEGAAPMRCSALRHCCPARTHSLLSAPPLPDASIFSLKEIQLQKDPGYRGSAFQQSGRTGEKHADPMWCHGLHWG